MPSGRKKTSTRRPGENLSYEGWDWPTALRYAQLASHTPQQVAKIMNVTIDTVLRAECVASLKLRRAYKRGIDWQRTLANAAVDDKSTSELADDLDVSYASVFMAQKRHSILLRRSKRGRPSK
jgi:hypothetical protein